MLNQEDLTKPQNNDTWGPKKGTSNYSGSLEANHTGLNIGENLRTLQNTIKSSPSIELCKLFHAGKHAAGTPFHK